MGIDIRYFIVAPTSAEVAYVHDIAQELQDAVSDELKANVNVEAVPVVAVNSFRRFPSQGSERYEERLTLVVDEMKTLVAKVDELLPGATIFYAPDNYDWSDLTFFVSDELITCELPQVKELFFHLEQRKTNV